MSPLSKINNVHEFIRECNERICYEKDNPETTFLGTELDTPKNNKQQPSNVIVSRTQRKQSMSTKFTHICKNSK